MLNHARTLLVNVDGGPFGGYLAEELADPDYRALALPSYLAAVRSPLFGVDPDRSMREYRTTQLLAVAQATPLGPYLFAFDPRVTYDFTRTALVGDSAFRPAVTPLGGAPAASFYGQPAAPDVPGRVDRTVFVEADGPTAGTVTGQRPPGPTVAFTGGLAPLGGTGYTLRLPEGTTAGDSWLFECRLRPRSTPAQWVAGVAGLPEPTLDALLGPPGGAEPCRTFRNVFFDHPELPSRLAAVVCALVWRTEEVRRG